MHKETHAMTHRNDRCDLKQHIPMFQGLFKNCDGKSKQQKAGGFCGAASRCSVICLGV